MSDREVLQRAEAERERLWTQIEAMPDYQRALQLEDFIALFHEFAGDLNADEESGPRPGGTSEVVTPSSDESVTGREAEGRLPARPDSPETASEAGRFDSGSLTEIVVKSGFESRPDAQASKGGPAGTGRSDGGERPATLPERPVIGPADPQRSEAATRKDAVPSAPENRKPSRLDRIRAVLDEHPDWTARQIGDEIGLDQKHVRKVAIEAGLVLKSGKVGRVESATSGPARPKTVKSRIIACHDEHPDWPAAIVAKHLSVPHSSVTGYGSVLGIKWPPMSAYQAAPTVVQEAREPISAPTPAENQPSPAQPADEGAESRRRKYGDENPVEVGDPDEDYVHPSLLGVKKPRGKFYRLRDKETGLYLHQDLHGMTEGLKMVPRNAYPWKGTRAQLDGVRKLLPATAKLVIVEVGK